MTVFGMKTRLQQARGTAEHRVPNILSLTIAPKGNSLKMTPEYDSYEQKKVATSVPNSIPRLRNHDAAS